MLFDEPKLTEGLVFRICHGTTCGPCGAEIERAARKHLDQHGLQDEVALTGQYCFGRCMAGPNVLVERWRDGGPSQQALRSVLALNQPHEDAVFEQVTTGEAIGEVIDRHLRAWRERR